MLIIAALAGTTWFFIDSSRAIYVVTSVLIVACPCALALSMPFTMGNALRILSKKGFYAKSAETIEDLSTTDTIVFDKTGTLTENKQAFVIYNGEKLTEFQTKAIKSISANSNHPLSKAINNYLEAGITKV